MSKLILLSLLLLLSCKTAEQIKREQQVDTLQVQVKQNQALSAEATSRLEAMEQEINRLAGKIEESEHHSKEGQRAAVNELKKEIMLTSELNQNLEKKITALEAKVEEQQKFITEVLETLKSLSANKNSKTITESVVPAQKDFGFADYKKGKHKEARVKLLATVDDKSIKAKTKAEALLYLGLISFKSKNYEESLTFLSRLYTDYPKSPHNSMGLLYLGRSFQRLGKNDEAKNSFNELIKSYPDKKEARDAASFLKEL